MQAQVKLPLYQTSLESVDRPRLGDFAGARISLASLEEEVPGTDSQPPLYCTGTYGAPVAKLALARFVGLPDATL